MSVMTCPECGEPMHAKTIAEWFPGRKHANPSEPFTTMTLLGYSSPPGHDHDDNCLQRDYICPAGHAMKVALRRRCPACDWVGKASCFCHPWPKVDVWPDEPITNT